MFLGAFALFILAGLSPAPVDVLGPIAVGQTRGGIPIVALQGGPWAVVSLHVRLSDGDLTPSERRALDAAAAALADGSTGKPRSDSADVSDAGGRTRFRVLSDSLVIAYGAPMERFDTALRAVDATLRDRGKLVAAVGHPDRWPADDPSVDLRALALAIPGHPLALPTSGVVDPAALRAVLDKLLRKDRVALSVVGPLPAAELLALVVKTVGTLLPAGPPSTSIPVELSGGTRLLETTDPAQKNTASTLWLLSPGRGSVGASAKDRAARAVLARLAGGRSEGNVALFGVAFDVTCARPGQAARAEAVPLAALEGIGTTPPPAELVEAARTKERAARLERWKDADAVADALGRALLAGDAALVDKELAALNDVTPADVAAAAKALLAGPRVIVRTLGAKR